MEAFLYRATKDTIVKTAATFITACICSENRVALWDSCNLGREVDEEDYWPNASTKTSVLAVFYAEVASPLKDADWSSTKGTMAGRIGLIIVDYFWMGTMERAIGSEIVVVGVSSTALVAACWDYCEVSDWRVCGSAAVVA